MATGVIQNGGLIPRSKRRFTVSNSRSNHQQITEISSRTEDEPKVTLYCSRRHAQNGVQKKPCRCRKTYTRVPIKEIRDLLHYSLLGKQCPAKPSWCNLRKVREISKVLMVVMHGVSSSCYRRNKECFKRLAEITDIGTKVEFPSGTNIVSEFFTAPVSAESLSQTKTGDSNIDDTPKKRSFYMLSQERLQQMNYPMRGDPGVISTNHSEAATDDSPLFAVDCEMCQTRVGLELTKVCVLNEEGLVILCKLVKPENHIVDYLTSYSGVTAEHLETVETRLGDIQRELKALLPPDAILVGQSLENDLRALEIHHPFCVDTSDMFTGPGHRVKLSSLAQFYLGRDIQCGSEGHDPIEDARASLDLFKLKLEKGKDLPKYGRSSKQNLPPVRIDSDKSLLTRCREMEKSCTVIDVRKTLRQFKDNADLVECINDAESFKKAAFAISRNDFLWVQFHHLDNLLQGNHISDDTLKMTLQKLDTRLHVLYQSLPVNSLLITLTVPSNSNQFGRCFVTVKGQEDI